jgi:hypothetical protein
MDPSTISLRALSLPKDTHIPAPKHHRHQISAPELHHICLLHLHNVHTHPQSAPNLLRRPLRHAHHHSPHCRPITQRSANFVSYTPVYAGIGGADPVIRQGLYPLQRSAPLTLGYSLIKRVHYNKSNSTEFKQRDLVACLTVYNAEAELYNQLEKCLAPVPEALDRQQAVALVLDWSAASGLAYYAEKISKGRDSLSMVLAAPSVIRCSHSASYKAQTSTAPHLPPTTP